LNGFITKILVSMTMAKLNSNACLNCKIWWAEAASVANSKKYVNGT